MPTKNDHRIWDIYWVIFRFCIQKSEHKIENELLIVKKDMVLFNSIIENQ